MPDIAAARHVRMLPGGVRALDVVRPALLVLDTPLVADGQRWLKAARRRGIAVASIHDLGIAPLGSDLAIDGSLGARRGIGAARRSLIGPGFMIVDPRVVTRRKPIVDSRLVVIALGGGSRARLAQRLGKEILHRIPDARVVIAAGFVASGGRPIASVSRLEWLGPRDSLAAVLGTAGAAVVAGGVTLYEAAALGVPTVAVPIVAAQRPTVRAFAREGAALAPGRAARIDAKAVAKAVGRLLDDRKYAGRIGRRGRQLIDGQGARRVARELRTLAGATR